MIGKSYDGTLANGVAATGVEGLTTIVPISAISSWYDYTRSNGVVTRGNSYPACLSNTVTDPGRRAYCAAVRASDGSHRRRRAPATTRRSGSSATTCQDAGNVRASVFVVHGLQDDNVTPDHFAKWWDALAGATCPAQALAVPGPATSTRSTSAARPGSTTLHRWFDH